MQDHASALAPGFRLDRYELLRPIAQGGMAEVWTARQTGKHGFEKIVAVKTILPKFADDEGFQRMFLDEAHVSSRIEHPNVAQILDVGEQDDVTYLVMEYVDGDALSTLHRDATSHGVRIPHGVLLHLMVEACGGLHAAHELRMADGRPAGVVHRDVSPHNILVSTKGAAKLIDFGLAKARDRMSEETSAGTVKGKLRYMAPEQVLGPGIDRRADVWAVGATLYHLIAGAPPYEAETDVEVVRALMSGAPPPRLGRAVHPALEAVVLRSLAWRFDQRFATALEFQQALAEATHAAGLEASASEVAAFVADHLGDRAQQRQEAISLAMREAVDREGVVGSERPSARLPLPSGRLPMPSPRPARPDPLPRELWTPPPVAAPSSSRTMSTASRKLVVPIEPAARGGSLLLASTLAVAVVVLGGVGLAIWRAHVLDDFPATTSAPTLPMTAAAAAAPPVAAGRAPSGAPVTAGGKASGSAGPAPVGSALSMTVSVTDLPVATASAARPRVVLPAARAQPRSSPATATGAGAGAEDTASDESEDAAAQGQ